MKNTILYCGIDVDDKYFHIGVKNSRTKEIVEFKTFPSVSALKYASEQAPYEMPFI